MMNKLLFVLAVVVLALGPAITASSRCETELRASDGGQADKMGTAVALSGNVAVFGAVGDDDNVGSAYVYRLDGSAWVEEQKLVASDRASNDWFGLSVAVDGAVIVIGAKNGDTDGVSNTGAAYVFRWNGSTWAQEQKLTASDAVNSAKFGISVDVSGDTIVVGAYGPTGWPIGNGAAYMYRFDGSRWIEEQKLTASDGGPGDRFGYSVAVHGSVVLAGAYFDMENGLPSGSAYVFRRSGSTWVQEAKLLDPEGQSYARFGYSVDVFGDLAVVGVENDSDKGLAFGSVYVFRFNGSASNPAWNEEAALYGSGSESYREFGTSVSVGDEVVAVGAKNAGRTASSRTDGAGAVYIFENGGSGWVETEKFVASDDALYDQLGTSVSISVSGDLVVAGAPMHNHNNVWGAGAVYMFAIPCDPVDCTTDADCDDGEACTVDTCVAGVCLHDGAGCVCEECVTLDADGDGDIDLADYAAFVHCIQGPT